VKLKKGLYRHYKGGEYEVLGVVRHSETEEYLALYRPLYGERALWVRPLEMFTGSVELAGESVPRFEWLAPALAADDQPVGQEP
jgi:hypothetical protein